MLSLTLPPLLLCIYIYIYIYRAFPVISPHTLVNSSLHLYLLLSFLLQSKHNEDVFATRPISLDKPEFEICLLPFFLLFFSSLLPIFPLPYATSCLMSISLSTSSLVMDGLVPFFFFFCFPG